MTDANEKIHGPKTTRPIRVLYVDDYVMDRELVRSALMEEHGEFDLTEAASKEAFEQALDEGSFDIVLSDFNILGFEGLDVLEEVRKVFPGLPVIIVTGTGSEEVAAESIKRGASDYIIKTPDNLRRLPHVISSVLDRGRLVQKQQETELQLLQAQKMESLGTLVAGMAHEINNPVNSIMLNVPILEKVWKDLAPLAARDALKNPSARYGGLPWKFLEDNLPQLISDISFGADRIAGLVTRLKDFARQSDVTEKSQVDINSPVRDALRLAKATSRKAGVSIELDLAQDLPPILAHAQSIEQIVLNLVINGFQAMDKEEGTIRVSTSLDREEGKILLVVEDNGRGIAPGLGDRVFDPFYTSRQAEGGTGLGLSVTYSLVKAHGGEIAFESEGGFGTTFTVTLPIGGRKRQPVILIADDDPAILRLLVGALAKDRAYRIETVDNGTEALMKMGTQRPDLFILDMLMPQLDGLQVCRSIKKEPALNGMQVIIITGFPEHDMVKEAKELGFSRVHAKPLDIKALKKEVNEVVEGERISKGDPSEPNPRGR